MAAEPATLPNPESDAAHALSRVLADTYVLYLKTHNFHWNVEGANFRTLHLMFAEQYQALWNSLNVLAERIRALGQYAPGTYAKYRSLAAVGETETIPTGEAMLRELVADHEVLVRTIQVALTAAHPSGDEGNGGDPGRTSPRSSEADLDDAQHARREGRAAASALSQASLPLSRRPPHRSSRPPRSPRADCSPPIGSRSAGGPSGYRPHGR